ncbi:hypothetical protein IT157_07730 [bacterium]|nr:hypothetical protein [bacterium]
MIRALLSILLCSVYAFAQSPLPNDVLGTRPGAFSPRSLALGHTYLTNQTGPAALMGNPATLADQSTEWILGLSADLSRVKETRSYPFYDAFNGVLGYNNYALNDHVYSKLDGGAAWKLPMKSVESFVVSLGSYSAYQFDYTYHEEVRNRFTSGGIQDRVLGNNIYENEGDLRAWSLGAASSQGRTAIGFSVSMLTGEWSHRSGVYYASPDSANMETRADYSLESSPAEVNFGGAYDLNERVRFAARALFPTGKLKYEADVESMIGDSLFESTAKSTVKYPSHIALGVQYRPQNDYRPFLYLEGEIHTYSDVQEDYDNVFEIRAGAEQQIIPGAPARIGLVYANSPSDKDRASTLFTAGIGFQLQKMHADFGMELGEMNYTSPDVFPQSLYGEADRIDSDRVETALFRGMISLSWEL